MSGAWHDFIKYSQQSWSDSWLCQVIIAGKPGLWMEEEGCRLIRMLGGRHLPSAICQLLQNSVADLQLKLTK